MRGPIKRLNGRTRPVELHFENGRSARQFPAPIIELARQRAILQRAAVPKREVRVLNRQIA